MRYSPIIALLLLAAQARDSQASERELAAYGQFTPLAARQQETVATPTSLKSKPPLRLAPRSPASKKPVSRPATANPGGAIGTVAGSLGIVLGLFVVVSWCLQRTGGKGNERLPKEALEVLGQASLAGRQQAQLVRLGNKLLLVATTSGGVETLAEVTEPTEVESLVAMCRRGQSGSATASFRDALTELSRGGAR
jgi:flagellar biogenesis protein FliO